MVASVSNYAPKRFTPRKVLHCEGCAMAELRLVVWFDDNLEPDAAMLLLEAFRKEGFKTVWHGSLVGCYCDRDYAQDVGMELVATVRKCVRHTDRNHQSFRLCKITIHYNEQLKLLCEFR